VEAQLFVFYFACHIGDIVNSVYCLKLTVVRVYVLLGEKRCFPLYVLSYILAKLTDTRLNVGY
jgi:hypothetical protein